MKLTAATLLIVFCALLGVQGACALGWQVHDECAALPVLARIPTLIACGDHDLLTPVKYSREMAAALPDSTLVVVPGAGHLVQLERPDVINEALVELVEQATPSRLVAFARRIRGRAGD